MSNKPTHEKLELVVCTDKTCASCQYLKAMHALSVAWKASLPYPEYKEYCRLTDSMCAPEQSYAQAIQGHDGAAVAFALMMEIKKQKASEVESQPTMSADAADEITKSILDKAMGKLH